MTNAIGTNLILIDIDYVDQSSITIFGIATSGVRNCIIIPVGTCDTGQTPETSRRVS